MTAVTVCLLFMTGLVSFVRGATYRLTAEPTRLSLGERLTLTMEVDQTSQPLGDIRLVLVKHSVTNTGSIAQIPVTIFDTRVGCRLIGAEYRDGRIVTCDPSGRKNVVTFPVISHSHVGIYRIEAPTQTPRQGPPVDVILLMRPVQADLRPETQAVIDNTGATLTCSTNWDATKPLTFIWTKLDDSGQGREVTDEARIVTLPNGYVSELKFDSVKAQNSGQYLCKVVNEVGWYISSRAELVVYHPPESVTLRASVTAVSAGTSVGFTCTSKGGNPKPQLVLYDISSGRTLKRFRESSTITKNMQITDDGKEFGCRTDTVISVGSIEQTISNKIKINVLFPSSGLIAPATVSLDEGELKALTCETSSGSNPRTVLEWSGPVVGNVTIEDEDTLHGVRTRLRMIIPGQRTLNRARYTCSAYYMDQVVFSSTAVLHVNFAPKSIDFYNTDAKPVLENEAKTFKCRSETSRPVGTIRWLKITTSGEKSELNPDSIRQLYGDYGGSMVESGLAIIAQRKDNDAKIWCESEYTYRNATRIILQTKSITLVVYYPVDVQLVVTPGVGVTEGDLVSFECQTTGGNPTKIESYTWSYNGAHIPGAGDAVLTLQSIKYDQGGKYACAARNLGGITRAETSVSVKYKPRLDPSVPHHSNIETSVGDTVTFTLKILASPEPSSAQWFRNGTYLLGNRYASQRYGMMFILQIVDVEEEDLSNFTCIVENAIGRSEFHFTVREPAPVELNMTIIIISTAAGNIFIIFAVIVAILVVIFLKMRRKEDTSDRDIPSDEMESLYERIGYIHPHTRTNPRRPHSYLEINDPDVRQPLNHDDVDTYVGIPTVQSTDSGYIDMTQGTGDRIQEIVRRCQSDPMKQSTHSLVSMGTTEL